MLHQPVRIADPGSLHSSLTPHDIHLTSETHVYEKWSSGLPVLLYHGIGPSHALAPPGLTVSAADFRRQMAWLAARGYHSATVEDCIAHACGNPSSKRLVVITFDDGYASLCDYAFPVLQHYGFTAIVFVPTALIGRATVWDEREGWGSQAIMSHDQIRMWSVKGVEFGSHTRTHPDLTRLHEAELADEIVGSSHDLEHLLATPTRAFAYPYGYVSESARMITTRTYPVAFSTIEGVNRPGGESSMLRRTMVFPADGLADLALILRFGVNHRARLRKRLGRWRRQLRPQSRSNP